MMKYFAKKYQIVALPLLFYDSQKPQKRTISLIRLNSNNAKASDRHYPIQRSLKPTQG